MLKNKEGHAMIKIKHLLSEALIEMDVSELKRKPGVWLLVGKDAANPNSSYRCLQVAQTNNVGKEIETDSYYMTALEPKSTQKKEYINQFGEKKFSYPEYDNWRTKNLYYTIFREYGDLTFIVLLCDELKERNTRILLEKYIAYKTKAAFWVNGRPFESEVAKEEKEKLRNKYESVCDEILNDLRHKIESKIIDELQLLISTGFKRLDERKNFVGA